MFIYILTCPNISKNVNTHYYLHGLHSNCHCTVYWLQLQLGAGSCKVVASTTWMYHSLLLSLAAGSTGVGQSACWAVAAAGGPGSLKLAWPLDAREYLIYICNDNKEYYSKQCIQLYKNLLNIDIFDPFWAQYVITRWEKVNFIHT